MVEEESGEGLGERLSCVVGEGTRRGGQSWAACNVKFKWLVLWLSRLLRLLRLLRLYGSCGFYLFAWSPLSSCRGSRAQADVTRSTRSTRGRSRKVSARSRGGLLAMTMLTSVTSHC